MIGITSEKINDIPCLMVSKTEDAHKPLPVLTYFHGFTSAKEHNLPLAYLMAEKGYRVILPDSDLHGARLKKDKSEEERQLSFWDIVLSNVDDMAHIKKYLDENGLLLNDRIGVAGTSMGGITVSALLTKYPWISAAAILMGTPKLTAFAQRLIDQMREHFVLTEQQIQGTLNQIESIDLSKQIEKLNNRPLLLWHGDNDQVVPFEHAYSFYKEVKSTYTDQDHICFLKEKNRDHKVSRYAILNTVRWFEQHL